MGNGKEELVRKINALEKLLSKKNAELDRLIKILDYLPGDI